MMSSDDAADADEDGDEEDGEKDGSVSATLDTVKQQTHSQVDINQSQTSREKS
jgi:hypothetical protein